MPQHTQRKKCKKSKKKTRSQRLRYSLSKQSRAADMESRARRGPRPGIRDNASVSARVNGYGESDGKVSLSEAVSSTLRRRRRDGAGLGLYS